MESDVQAGNRILTAPTTFRRRALASVAASAFSVTLLMSGAHADSTIYTSRYNVGGLIASVKTDGSNLTPSFLDTAVNTIGAVVNNTTGKLYYTGYANGTVGVVNLDGSGRNDSLISGRTGRPLGITVDETHGALYWAEDGGARIVRSNLDGSGVTTLLTVTGAYDVALDVPNNKLYYCSIDSGLIGRSDLDGSNNNPSFINTGATGFGVYGLGADASNIYWTSYSNNSIGRATLAGTGINNSFITGASGPQDVYADSVSGKIFWSNGTSGTIGSATLAGGSVNHSFATGVTGAWGMAGAVPEPGTAFLAAAGAMMLFSRQRRKK